MPVPVIYRNQGERGLANYDYVDIADGSGFVTFTGFTISGAGLTKYKLGTEDVYSLTRETEGSSTENTYNFDTSPFNLPRVVKGTAMVSINCYNNDACGFSFQLKKSGASLVNISDEHYFPIGDSATAACEMYLIELPCTETIVKKGETLRLAIQCSAATGTIAFGHDPKGRSGAHCDPESYTDTTTKLQLYVPFKIDL